METLLARGSRILRTFGNPQDDFFKKIGSQLYEIVSKANKANSRLSDDLHTLWRQCEKINCSDFLRQLIYVSHAPGRYANTFEQIQSLSCGGHSKVIEKSQQTTKTAWPLCWSAASSIPELLPVCPAPST